MLTKPLAFVRAKTETVIFAFAFNLALNTLSQLSASPFKYFSTYISN